MPGMPGGGMMPGVQPPPCPAPCFGHSQLPLPPEESQTILAKCLEGWHGTDVARRGAGEILLTSMDRDGTKIGFNLALTRAVADAVPIPVIASGGVGTLDHFVDGIVEGKANAVLAASVFHFGTYSIGQVKNHMAQAGIPTRKVVSS